MVGAYVGIEIKIAHERENIMKVKRTLLMLTVVGILTIGCTVKDKNITEEGGYVKNDKKTQLQIAVFEGGYGREYWDAVSEAFEEENEDIDVVILSHAEIGEIIRPTIIAKNPPDFVYLPSNNVSGITSTLVKDKALTDITDVMKEVEDKLLPGFLDTRTCQPYGDGKIYLAPMYYSPLGMWYNKNFFEKNDLQVPATWEEFFALGKNDKTGGRALFAYQGIYPSYMESMILSPIASSGGKEVMNACLNYEEGAWHNENVRQVLDNIARIGTEGYLMDGTVFMDHTQAQAKWLQGEALFIPSGAWIEKECLNLPREEGFQFGFAAPPAIEKEGTRYICTRIEEMYIPSGAKHVEAAKRFLAFQYSDQAIELNAKYAYGVPPVKGAAEKIKPYVSDAIYESYQIYEKGYEPYMGDFARVLGTNIVPQEAFYRQIGEVMSGELTVEEWTDYMEDISSQVRSGKIE